MKFPLPLLEEARVFFRPTKREIIDEQLGLQVTRERNHIRVVIGDRNLLFAESSPEQFLQHYRCALDAIEFEFEPAAHGNQTLEFSPGEQDEIRRDIALLWIRYYLSTEQRVQIQPKDLKHPQTWAIVLQKAEAKYGEKTEEATALAAHTVGLELKELEQWRRVEDDRVANM